MKKIIWIFGESATGKKTFIETIMNKSNMELIYGLDLNDKKIAVVEITVSKNVSSFDNSSNEKFRNEQILKSVQEFINNSKNEVLLLKGQSNDMKDIHGNTLKEVALLYPKVEKQIYLLEVNDMDLLYSRFTEKDWFLNDVERYSKMFPREWIDGAVLNHRKEVTSYKDMGYKITNIDATQGFTPQVKKRQNR